MKKSYVVLMAVLAVIAAVPASAQNRRGQRASGGSILWAAPGERVNYAGAVDDWTGSPAQLQLERTRSYITGPLNDLQRHWNATNGTPDPYYGTGVSPAYPPVGYRDSYATGGRNYGPECYGGVGCGPYMWGRRYSWNDARYTHSGRYGVRNPLNSRHGLLNIRLNVGGGGNRSREEALAQQVEDLRQQRDEALELQRGDSESANRRSYYADDANDRPRRNAPRAVYTVINGTGDPFCLNGKRVGTTGPDSRTTTNDPDNLEITPTAADKPICEVQADFVNETTIHVTCIAQEGR